MKTLLLIAALSLTADDDSASVRALRALPNVSHEFGTYEWTGKAWVFREKAATVEKWDGVYEWISPIWYWTSSSGKRFWHDGRTWQPAPVDSVTPQEPQARPMRSLVTPRQPQNRYGIQWSR